MSGIQECSIPIVYQSSSSMFDDARFDRDLGECKKDTLIGEQKKHLQLLTCINLSTCRFRYHFLDIRGYKLKKKHFFSSFLFMYLKLAAYSLLLTVDKSCIMTSNACTNCNIFSFASRKLLKMDIVAFW